MNLCDNCHQESNCHWAQVRPNPEDLIRGYCSTCGEFGWVRVCRQATRPVSEEAGRG